MIRKLPHCSPRGWPAILSSPAHGRPSLSEGDRAAAPRGWLRDRPNRALPGRAITYDRVENDQQLAGDRDEGDLLRLAHCYEALIEGLEHWVVARGDHSAHEQGFAHARPPSANEALATPLAGLTGEGGEADQRRDLLAIKASKFRQLGNQGPRDCRADGGYRGQQVLLLTPGWRAAHGIVDVLIDARELTLERLHEPADALLDAGIGPVLTLPLRADHVDDLTTAEPGTSTRHGKIFTTWTHGNIEAVLRSIDTNGDLLHGDPSLSKRARGAAPATVRVRWNGGRGAKLSNGLRGPKVRRTPARHRASLARRVG